jgi:nitrite reductase/ring-hydroxylating ferredoxin subunit
LLRSYRERGREAVYRTIAKLVDRQASWADPLAESIQGRLNKLFAQQRRVKDVLNGTWLGHPVHPMVTDVPVGAMTVATLLDATGQERAADLAIATGLGGMAVSAVTGAADAADAYGRPRVIATVHATLMVTSVTAYAGSLLMRLGPGRLRPLARLLSLGGYGALAAGAYVGGDLTYRVGNQVDRHAFETAGPKWKPLDVAEVPVRTLVRAKAGNDPLVLYRADETSRIEALHATCAHAGGPLDKGSIVDGCVQCPWHGSQFRLSDGHVVHGPSVYDQPSFEVRESEGGGLEARRVATAPSGPI